MKIFGQKAFTGAFTGAFQGSFSDKGGVSPPPELVLDLNSFLGVTGDPVSAWADQSGKGNNALGSATHQPAFNPTGINGQKSLTFSILVPQDWMVISDDDTLALTKGYSTYVVTKGLSYISFGSFWSKGVNNNRITLNTITAPTPGLNAIGIGTEVPFQQITSPGPGTLPAVATPMIVEVHFSFFPKRVDFLVNGTSMGSANHSLNDIQSDPTKDMFIGSVEGFPTQGINMEIGRIKIFKNPILNEEDRLAERQELATQFAIDIGQPSFLLLESGDKILLESGDKILTEGST